jgi:hypothetical protein
MPLARKYVATARCANFARSSEASAELVILL